MPGHDFNLARLPGWAFASRSLSVKLVLLLVAAMVAIFSLLGYLNVHLHRKHMEAITLGSAEMVSDVIKRSTSYYMLRNDREGLYHVIGTIAHEPGIRRIRIFNQQGRISFSTEIAEVNSLVDKRAEACYGCHSQAQPLARLDRPDRFRIYRHSGGERLLGIINPIENSPACSNASCHAHPPGQKILGVLDTNLSLAQTDANLASDSLNMLAYTLLAVSLISTLSGFFVFRFVYGPLKRLKMGTEKLAAGDLGLQIEVQSSDELGELARSFNSMSRELREAREEATGWARTLESRVEEKTQELKCAHEHMLHAEKMASIGKLAAVVAHEINNPLAGILTYSKLLKKWFTGGGGTSQTEILNSLDLIESESRRCGDIVKNLLTFARATPMNFEATELDRIIDRCLRLVQHKLQLGNIQLSVDVERDLPAIHCDPAQIEQVLLALIMNAIDAMPAGGNLCVRARRLRGASQVQLQVGDDGEGISPELLPRLFEPFFTTKDRGHSVGLGLAISHSIIERHQGRIEVASEPNRETVFTITLPVRAVAPVHAGPGETILERGRPA